jgi:hypothetical protein
LLRDVCERLATESVVTGSALVLGGYGNFGKRIAAALIKHDVKVIVAGRSLEKAEAKVRILDSPLAKAAAFDAMQDLGSQLQALRPSVVVNTVGPFQTSDYRVARACIEHGVHYVDLADGRDFVTGIMALNEAAKRAGVSVIAGASTVPGLSSAVLEHYANEFAEIDELIYGISPGQKAERGLATTQGILTYVGRPLRPFAGVTSPVYGWQDLYRQDYPELGRRWMANCDIPDLDLLPPCYRIKSIRFSAGLELSLLHLGLWGLGWLIRLGLPLGMPRHARTMLKTSNLLNSFGSADGGMHMILRGCAKNGARRELRWFIVAKDGDGPQIPCVPAILLARSLARGEEMVRGAYACVGLVSLEDYARELRGYRIAIQSLYRLRQ